MRHGTSGHCAAASAAAATAVSWRHLAQRARHWTGILTCGRNISHLRRMWETQKTQQISQPPSNRYLVSRRVIAGPSLPPLNESRSFHPPLGVPPYLAALSPQPRATPLPPCDAPLRGTKQLPWRRSDTPKSASGRPTEKRDDEKREVRDARLNPPWKSRYAGPAPVERAPRVLQTESATHQCSDEIFFRGLKEWVLYLSRGGQCACAGSIDRRRRHQGRYTAYLSLSFSLFAGPPLAFCSEKNSSR